MGQYDPQVRVGTSGTGAALGRNYATNAATAGRVLTSQGDDLPPVWATPAPGVLPVSRVLFVDAVNSPGATADGTLAAPYPTLQAAINATVVRGWHEVQLQIAMATYPDPVAIPSTIWNISLVGWNAGTVPIDPVPVLGGDITFTTGGGLANGLQIVDCIVTAAHIATAQRAQDMFVSLVRTNCAATITAENLELSQTESTQHGAVTGQTTLVTHWDGYSWAASLKTGTAYSPPGYSREFLDAGHDVYSRSLTINGLAIGATGFVTMAVSTGAFVRAGDHAQVRVNDPAIQDFICGIHGVGPGSVTCWITNLSRVSTNFAEGIQLLIHHNDMIAEPAP